MRFNKLKCLLLSNVIVLSQLSAGFLDSSSAITVHGDYLYWQVSQDQMQYAANLPGGIQQIIQTIEEGEFPSPFAELDIIDSSFQYKSGFRVGAAYADSCSNWDVRFDWTSLHQTVNSSIFSDAQGIVPLNLPVATLFGFISGDPASFGFASGATSSWKLKFDTYELNIGKTYSFLNCLVCHPYIGVKGATIKQNQNISYLGFTLGDTAVIATSNNKNNFYGVGPSFGFESSWEVLDNLNLNSGVCASLLYGKFNVDQTPLVVVDTLAVGVVLNNSKKHRLCPTVDANLGFDYSTCLMDQFHLTVGVSYELQYWWNQWQAPASFVSTLITGGSTTPGDLMMQGLTASLAITF